MSLNKKLLVKKKNTPEKILNGRSTKSTKTQNTNPQKNYDTMSKETPSDLRDHQPVTPPPNVRGRIPPAIDHEYGKGNEYMWENYHRDTGNFEGHCKLQGRLLDAAVFRIDTNHVPEFWLDVSIGKEELERALAYLQAEEEEEQEDPTQISKQFPRRKKCGTSRN